MSDLGMMEPEAPEMLAAEYVLGTLDAAEARAAEARRAGDAAFDGEVRFWEGRLYPLTGLVAAVPPPPSVWTRIEDTTGGMGAAPAGVAAAPANDNRLGWWRALAVGGLAVAAGLALFVAVRPAPAPEFAVLSPAGSTAGVLVVVAGPGGALLVRASGTVAVAEGKDLELWALAAGASTPAALGVLQGGERSVPAGVAPGTALLVSLEPKGGSPTGLPTGPVVYQGVLRVLQ